MKFNQMKSESVEKLRSIRRQLDSGLGRKLRSHGQPGHCDYISKADAGKWCATLASELTDVIDAETKGE